MGIIVDPRSEFIRDPHLIIPSSQPRGMRGVKINWQHESTQGLVAAYLFNKDQAYFPNIIKSLDGLGPDIHTLTDGAVEPLIWHKRGYYGLYQEAGWLSYSYFAAGEIPTGGERYSCIMYGIKGWSASSGVFTIYGPSGGVSDFQIWFSSTTHHVQPHNGDGTDLVAHTSGITDRVIHGIYWQDAISNEQKFFTYKDHQHTTVTGSVNCTTFPASGRKFLIGVDADALGPGGDGDGSLAQYFGGVYSYLFFFNRKIEEAEARRLNANPYQFLIPR